MSGRANLSIRLVVLVFLAVFGAARIAQGRTIYVDDEGPADFNNIQAAIDDSNDGDIVVVGTGRYYETINFVGRNIVVMSEAPEDPDVVAATIIDANGNDSVVIFENGETPEAVLTGFTITGGYGMAIGTEEIPEFVLFGGGVFCYQASPTIKNNVITNNHGPIEVDANGMPIALGYGVGISCIESGALVTNNIIRDNSGYAGGAMMTYLADARISNNLIYGNTAWVGGGVIIMGASQLIGNTIAANNAIIDYEGIIIDGIAGNVYAVTEAGLGQYLIVNNVICYTANGGGILFEGLFEPESVAYNNIWGNEPGDYIQIDPDTGFVIVVPGQTGINGNISKNPMFVNPVSHDYHLRQVSPCINAGDTDFVPAPGETDIDGGSRVMGGRVDMGADEWPGPWVLFVDIDATGANNGSSWEDAYNYLQDALAAASSGDEIRVAEGIYKPARPAPPPPAPMGWSSGWGAVVTSGDRTATFPLKNGVVIKGGYAGFGEPGPNARDIEVYKTVLSGDLLGNDGPDFANNGENSYHVVTGSGTDETAVLDGFTITGGNANAPPLDWPNFHGGGIYNSLCSANFANCTFKENTARYSGGGMFNDRDSRPTLANCAFIGNSAGEMGGGMHNWNSSSPTLTNCTFAGNSASVNGGGMLNSASSPTLDDCVFSENTANRDGGGVFNNESNPTVTNCTFRGNTANYDGGAMCNRESSPTVTKCVFRGNSANHGGGISNWPGSPNVKNCIFGGNSAELGGGIFNWDSSPTLSNCIFNENSARELGGGMCNLSDSMPTVNNCTFRRNSADYGGGMYNDESSPRLTNCILWGDTPEEIYGGAPVITYSDVEGDWEEEGNIDEDPCFVDPGSGDFHLRAGSPCINAGDPADDYSGQTDIDGQPRVILGRVDMGVDEFNPFEVSFKVVNKRRIGRTEFEYECRVTLENVSRFTVRNVQLEMVKASDNMTIIEPAVTFIGDIGPGGWADSVDTCAFEVDRTEAIDPAEIIWTSTCEMGDTGETVEQGGSSFVFLGMGNMAGDLTGDDEVDFEDFARLAGQWLWVGPEGGIPEDIIKDGTVNLADFAKLAEKWQGER